MAVGEMPVSNVSDLGAVAQAVNCGLFLNIS